MIIGIVVADQIVAHGSYAVGEIAEYTAVLSGDYAPLVGTDRAAKLRTVKGIRSDLVYRD